MTTITLDIPDALAERLAHHRKQLPAMLAMMLELFPDAPPLSTAPTSHPVYTDMLDFLASGPTPARILEFKISAATQARLETLLDTQSAGDLSAEEAAELEAYAQVNHLLILLKARTRRTATMSP